MIIKLKSIQIPYSLSYELTRTEPYFHISSCARTCGVGNLDIQAKKLRCNGGLTLVLRIPQ